MMLSLYASWVTPPFNTKKERDATLCILRAILIPHLNILTWSQPQGDPLLASSLMHDAQNMDFLTDEYSRTFKAPF